MGEDMSLGESVVGILAAVANADGQVADTEAGWWLRTRRTHPLLAGLPHEDVEAMLARAGAVLATTSPQEAVAQWAAHVPDDHADAVYALALDLQLADGASAREETRTTAALAVALGLSAERAAAVFETLLHARGIDF